MGIDPYSQTYLLSSLKGNKTVVCLGRQQTREITFNRGVKQGDSVSPLLFNIIMDEFVDLSNARGYGGTIAARIKVASLAFADDLLLLEENPDRMIVSLEQAKQFLRSRGMEINASKCYSATTMRHRGAIRAINRSTFTLDGVNIPAVTNINPAKYLCHNISSYGVLKANIQNNGSKTSIEPRSSLHEN